MQGVSDPHIVPSPTRHQDMNTLEQAVNLKVEVTTLIDETIVGTIYAFSPNQHVIALKTSSSSAGNDLFRIINSSFIKSITIAHPIPKRFHKTSEFFKGRPVDLKKLETRLKHSLEKASTVSSRKPTTAEAHTTKSTTAASKKGAVTNSTASSTTPSSASIPAAAPLSARPTNSAQAVHKKLEPSPLALKVYDKLVGKFGKENVMLQSNDSVLLFKEVAIGKPYALNRISNSRRSQQSKHLEKVKTALREIWLLGNNSKQGG